MSHPPPDLRATLTSSSQGLACYTLTMPLTIEADVGTGQSRYRPLVCDLALQNQSKQSALRPKANGYLPDSVVHTMKIEEFEVTLTSLIHPILIREDLMPLVSNN